MDYTTDIVQLYSEVFDSERTRYNVSVYNFKRAIKSINEAYSRNPDWQTDYTSKTTDFGNPAARCAYLHKYAMIHSGLMCKILQMIFRRRDIYNELKPKQKLNLCSLGGGPGTEIVSLMLVIQEIFGSIPCSVRVIDYSLEWKQVFESIIAQLKTGRYGQVKNIVSNRYFDYDYHSADLLNTSYYNLYQTRASIKNADIITMIKFISAAACDKTKAMVMKIFQVMKPGGLLLFVDNAAGGFDKLIRDTASECGMITVFGPVKHYDYEEADFSLERYGYTSQFKTRVSIQMWKKPQFSSSYNATAQLQREFWYGPRREVGAYPVREFDSPRNINVSNYSSEEESGCCSII